MTDYVAKARLISKQYQCSSKHNSGAKLDFIGLWILIICMPLAKCLQCVECKNAMSNHDCNLSGRVKNCILNQNSCYTEVRKHNGIYGINKGCMQVNACRVQVQQNFANLRWPRTFPPTKRCNSGSDNSVCHSCCSFDTCNLAELPSISQRNKSCIQFFPLCRAVWWNERNGFLSEGGRFLGCHCDSSCEENNDCCADYQAVCVGVLPTSMRSEDPYGGATGGEYNKVLPRGGGLPYLRCFVCTDASSNEECNRIGTIEECQPNQRSCVTEVRVRQGRKRITKRCEQSRACESLQRSNQNCDRTNGVCYSCCQLNYCNIFELPHTQNFSMSCLSRFPGFPQCKRTSLSECSNSNCDAEAPCSCDNNCQHFNDCCPDFNEICASPETTNLDWLFQEISQSSETNEEEEDVFGRDLFEPRDYFSGLGFGLFNDQPLRVHHILEDRPTDMAATPQLIAEMKSEKCERDKLLEEKRTLQRENKNKKR